ncbi:uncharacterized protein BT62DRAFT_1072510 [Guyanagaster necrorhizus]|uniref:Uncharacterized protein n=1 Tax=Guyanagaster necrorhizus TaxID=856835 RepID=A0A9P7VZF5_9AGAR|nr:uncharacterized protein BT62DRAFT_1072510 [Guyanagaster necrorhizus MCA 3950]KAG7450436.1 hypothetical protein BT62DRAFT_1072510 [Guyanagaster necrorhizus MCA 3950]
MPTSTVPYEVLFDFTNDTNDLVTVQPIAQNDGISSRGAILLMKEGDNVSLVLTAGCTYQYALQHRSKKAYISLNNLVKGAYMARLALYYFRDIFRNFTIDAATSSPWSERQLHHQ